MEESTPRTAPDSGLQHVPPAGDPALPNQAEPTLPSEDAGSQVEEVEPSKDEVEAAKPQRRSLKLVLSLTPRDSGGYGTLMAVGGDDCDPLLRSVIVEDVAAALAELASLVAEAQARWQIQPRNPAVPKKSGGASGRRPSTLQLPSDQSQVPGRESPDPEPVPAGQLTLFG
jgi:hypothetical protein